METNRAVIIVGGGSSINEKEIKPFLANTNALIIGCNIACKFFRTDINIFLDHRVYISYKDILSSKPCVGLYRNLEEYLYPEVYWIPHKVEYSRLDKKGMYTGMLTGTAAISLAIYLLAGRGDIYLLGYDWGGKTTHFHNTEGDYFEGYNKVNYYQERSTEHELGVFKKEKGVNIFNVNPHNTIPCFSHLFLSDMIGKLSSFPADLQLISILSPAGIPKLDKVRFHPYPH